MNASELVSPAGLPIEQSVLDQIDKLIEARALGTSEIDELISPAGGPIEQDILDEIASLGLRAAAYRETAVHQAADAAVGSMKSAILYAFAVGRRAINRHALQVAIEQKDSAAAIKATAAAPEAVAAGLRVVLQNALHRVFVAGGKAGYQMLLDHPHSKMRGSMRSAAPSDFTLRSIFNAISPTAIAWAKDHATELITDLSDTSREDIADAIIRGLKGEASVAEIVREILAAVGDEARADTIARTETMTAANAGLQESWNQAVDHGLLTGDEKKQWIATGDEITCPICEGLDGETVSLGANFSTGDGEPPAHPNCRCTMGIVG